MKNRQILVITQTAVMLALLIGAQFITRSFGQFVTGSLVYLILLTSVFMTGLGGGLAVAVTSPFLAFFVGIGPAFIQIVPLVAAGNAVLVLIARFAGRYMAKRGVKETVFAAIWIAAAVVVKTAFLWAGIVLIALPMIPGINENQAAVISAAFSWPQLVTGSIGGALALMIVPLLKKAIKT